MEKSEKIMLLSTIILVGFFFGVVFHYCLGFYLNLNAPYSSFIYPAKMAFCDFTYIVDYAKNLNPYHEVVLWACYFPLAYIFLFPFSLIKNFFISYSLYLSVFLIYLIHMNIKNFYCENLSKLENIKNIFILSVISYPVLYMLDKGNLDSILFIILGMSVYAFKAEKYKWAAILLAIENAFKPFPIFFLMFFLLKKKYKEFFLSLFLTAVLVLGGFLVLKGNFFRQIIIFLQSLAAFKGIYAMGNYMGIGFSSSLFMLLKIIFLHFSTNLAAVVSFVKIYDFFSYAATIATLVFVWKEKLFWKQIALLMFNFLLFPYCTYDYKFIFLFIPIWLFVNEDKKSKFDLLYIILFSLLFIPKSVIFSLPGIHNGQQNWTSLSVILNPIIMVAFSLTIIYEQIATKKNELKKKGI